MNCKQGDLAVIVGCDANHEHLRGMFVTCVKPFNGPWKHPDRYAPGWKIDREIMVGGMLVKRVPDRTLKPIRDNDKEDETLSWKAVPKPVIIKLPVMIK